MISCEKNGYEIEYQQGYPNKLAGNWVAFDYQMTKENYSIILDTINDFNLSDDRQLSNFISLLNLISVSDEYSLVSALDPSNNGQLIFNNIYNSGIRTRVSLSTNHFDSRLSEQLEVINNGVYEIYYVSVSGQLVEEPDGDVLYIVVGLYDNDQNLFDSMIVVAYRKTGFEDTKYQSLLDN